MKRILTLLLALLPLWLAAQTVSGVVTDTLTGETLIGATVMDMRSGKGTVTNANGRYSLTLRADSADLRISYIGYRTVTASISLKGNRQLNVRLHPAVELQEVTISADRVNSPKMSQMSAIAVPVEQIKLVPVIFGESDVLKAIQLLPGVQSGSEGMSGIYVRGGGPDQNLFLLDGVPLYNVNHLGGFFSAFNGDAVKNVTLYKGSFPARFSGRISSVLDIATNDGHYTEWHGNAAVGLIAAKVSVEGPIIKEKTTMSLSLRRTYGDLLLKPMLTMVAVGEEGVKGLSAGYYFYDLNAKVTHKFSDRSRLYASLYSGDDEAYMRIRLADDYYANEEERLSMSWKWGNLSSALRWNYQLNDKMFMNLTGSYTRYRQRMMVGEEIMWLESGNTMQHDEIEMGMNSGISDVSARADFDYAPSPEHAVKFGGVATLHTFVPQVHSTRVNYGYGDADNIDRTFGDEPIHAGELTAYAEDDWSLTEALKVNAGLALTGFAVGSRFYPSVQPRLSGRLMLAEDLSLKVGYSYMTQYMHLLSTTSISLPTDLWVPVTERIEPMNSHQVAAGLSYTWKNLVDFSVEGYYKHMDNLLEYKPGSTFLGGSMGWEDMVCGGEGWAYGVEFLAQKSVGSFTGWLGYTWSRTMRLFDRPGEELNGGKPFHAKYDRTHDVSLSLQYKLDERFDCGLTWVYCTGNRATLATQRMESDYWGYVGFVDERNNFQLPAYHRMDVSVNFHKQKKHGVRTWNVSIYNLYNRQNPFIIYPRTTMRDTPEGIVTSTRLMQRSLFPILPSVTYIYKF